jgi:hypothetical protein
MEFQYHKFFFFFDLFTNYVGDLTLVIQFRAEQSLFLSISPRIAVNPLVPQI